MLPFENLAITYVSQCKQCRALSAKPSEVSDKRMYYIQGLARAQRLVGPRSLGRGRMRQRDMLQRFEHRLDRPRQACLATQLSFLDAGR